MSPKTTSMVCALLAAVCFALLDAVTKELTQHISVLQTVWARFTGQAVLVCLLVLPRLRRTLRTNFPEIHLARSIFLLVATGSYYVSLSKIGLFQATALINIYPLVLPLAALVFLGGSLGAKSWLAIFVACAAAGVMIGQGPDGFVLYAILPLIAAVCHTGYSLLTKMIASREDPWTSLMYSMILGAVILSAIMPIHWEPIDGKIALMMGAMAVLGTSAQMLIIQIWTLGQSDEMPPTAFLGTALAFIIGYQFFGEMPDLITIASTVVIVVAGIYVWRESIKRS
ncbi:MAG: DMT family transporter [Thalassovita sp.]